MLKLISLGELRKILGELRGEFYFRRGTEMVPLGEALGRELAEDVRAVEASPKRHTASSSAPSIAIGVRASTAVTSRRPSGDRS